MNPIIYLLLCSSSILRPPKSTLLHIDTAQTWDLATNSLLHRKSKEIPGPAWPQSLVSAPNQQGYASLFNRQTKKFPLLAQPKENHCCHCTHLHKVVQKRINMSWGFCLSRWAYSAHEWSTGSRTDGKQDGGPSYAEHSMFCRQCMCWQ